MITAKDTSGTTVTANSSDSGNGGSSVVGAYQINVGLDVFVAGTGWGASAWGSGGWGSASALSELNQLRLWSLVQLWRRLDCECASRTYLLLGYKRKNIRN